MVIWAYRRAGKAQPTSSTDEDGLVSETPAASFPNLGRLLDTSVVAVDRVEFAVPPTTGPAGCGSKPRPMLSGSASSVSAITSETTPAE
jgi:hypothetical protein